MSASSEWLPPQPSPAPSVPAGWYSDPQGRGQRYWDGSTWTDHLAPLAAPAMAEEKHPATTGDWIGGLLLSVLIPLAGFILGIVWAAKGGKRGTVGLVCVGASVLAFVIWAGILYGAGSDPTATYGTV